jgi:hypothetical protein
MEAEDDGDVDAEAITKGTGSDRGCHPEAATVVAHTGAVDVLGNGVWAHGEFDVVGWIRHEGRHAAHQRLGGVTIAVSEHVHVAGGASAGETQLQRETPFEYKGTGGHGDHPRQEALHNE